MKDDVLDEKKGGIKSSIFYNAYKKAKREYPQIDLTVKTCYERLLKLERENTDSIDIVSDCFAEMLKEISVVLFEDKSTEYTQNLTYAIGKWIYLIDALDDYDKDIKKQNFNVFYNVYKSSDYLTLIKEHEKDIVFVFSTIFIQISENYSKIPMQYNTDLVVNILTRGIPTKTKQILNKGKENNGQVL